MFSVRTPTGYKLELMRTYNPRGRPCPKPKRPFCGSGTISRNRRTRFFCERGNIIRAFN